MTRAFAVCTFLLRDLFRSLAGVIPPVLTLGVYQATFYFSGKVDYFVSVGAGDMMFVCLITTLILAGRINHAATYPILARLGRRSDLLAGIALASLLITLAMSVLLATLVIHLNGLTLSLDATIPIVPRWLALVAFTIALGLNMSKLASKMGSYLYVTAVVAFMVTVSEQQVFLQGQASWIVSAVALVASPITTLVTSPLAAGPSVILVPMLLTYVYASALSWLAMFLFEQKDLAWSE